MNKSFVNSFIILPLQLLYVFRYLELDINYGK